MLKRSHKVLFYTVANPFMALSKGIYKTVLAPGSKNKDKTLVQLGPGQENYLANWINVDANIFTGKADVWANLDHSLPFKDQSVDCFYSHHVIEHLKDLPFHFSELYRCLKPKGVIRIGGPHGDNAIKKFLENDHEWFSDFPDKRESIGGRLENFIFCRQEHLTILTFSYLKELAHKVGFSDVKICTPAIETNYPEFIDEEVLSKEHEENFEVPHTLILEAYK